MHYQLLSMERQRPAGVKTRVGVDDPTVPSVIDLFPTADFQEREVYDFFGVVFEGHPDMRRILMPEDYVGHPQRRDFPMGGEPVLFTFNEHELPAGMTDLTGRLTTASASARPPSTRRRGADHGTDASAERGPSSSPRTSC